MPPGFFRHARYTASELMSRNPASRGPGSNIASSLVRAYRERHSKLHSDLPVR